MKTHKLKQLLVPGLIFFSQQVFGQLPAIDSLKLIPQNPLATDEIKVVCYATFSSGSCDLNNNFVIVQGNQLLLTLEYAPGAATYICHSVDTISLGYLSPGDYDLDVNLVITPMDAIKDHDSLHFSVRNALGFDENTNPFEVAIYPNPFQQELRIKTDAIIEKIELNSVSGQKIRKEITLGHDKTIDFSELKDGIYLLVLTDNKGNQLTRRIFKNAL